MTLSAFLCVAFLATTPASPPADAPAAVHTERYRYVAYPAGDEAKSRTETTYATIRSGPNGDTYGFLVESDAGIESGWIRTETSAVFVDAYREVIEDDGIPSEVDSLWVDGSRVVVRRDKPREGTREMKDFDIPDDKPLAVDASLLLWMRRFPFAQDEPRKVFMVDFSQHKVTVTVARRGVESVTVPAGTFECYHMEVVVRVLIFKATIHFWLTTDAPHFLVRHEGRRGPFSATYHTELVAIGDEAQR